MGSDISPEALISFLIALSGVIPREYEQSLESSGLFRALNARSVPSTKSLDGYLRTVESFGNPRKLANISFSV
ncbi:hypothetical protein BLNAU_12791 [Blattamonas nauphoetae]|uniref:Uncharacterized protein n=1 Tax=Blattamonas nauphoetae TaxID=2049346 RepID=A0ABQ9XLH8_9EUKA|nr:hypothetical protein BLNAU_12791 [Blattamonas nauphoetae]